MNVLNAFLSNFLRRLITFTRYQIVKEHWERGWIESIFIQLPSQAIYFYGDIK